MAKLPYSATDREGKPVQGLVAAGSVQAARDQLAGAGLRDIVLHHDPALGGGLDARDVDGLDARQLRQLARVTIAAMRRPGPLPVLAEVARIHRFWLLVDAALFAWGWISDSRWVMASAAALAALPFVLALWNYRHAGRYNALLRCFAVGDWPRVRRLAEQLHPFSGRVRDMGFDLDLRVAFIAARDGRLHEALESVERWRDPLASRPGLFEQRIAPLHYAAGSRKGFVREMAQAYAAAPGEPARALDLALAHARFGEVAEAERLLREVDVGLLPAFAAGFVSWTKGMILLRRQHPDALRQLARAVSDFLKLSANPAVWTALAFCACDHAIALSLAGRKDQARAELAKVWPIIEAHGDRALLRMLETDGLAPT